MASKTTSRNTSARGVRQELQAEGVRATLLLLAALAVRLQRSRQRAQRGRQQLHPAYCLLHTISSLLT